MILKGFKNHAVIPDCEKRKEEPSIEKLNEFFNLIDNVRKRRSIKSQYYNKIRCTVLKISKTKSGGVVTNIEHTITILTSKKSDKLKRTQSTRYVTQSRKADT